jgi:MFS family permease
MYFTFWLSRYKALFSGLIGNILDHYDTALYGFMAPFIAPLIFPESSFIAALIKTYGLMSLSLITRPLGAIFFGHIATRFGAKQALFYSLIGLALITCAMGLLPTHAHIGETAPLLLAFLRLAQGFCAAGENTVAPFFVLDNAPPKHRAFVNSIYQSSTILGELAASWAALLVSISAYSHIYWRIPFLLSFLTALAALYMRLSVREKYSVALFKKYNIINIIYNNKIKLLRIICVSGMSYITYSIPFVFFNNFIPAISTVTYSEMIKLNSFLLLFDMLLAPLYGFIADKINPSKLMAFMTIFLAIGTPPLFYYLEGSDLSYVSAVRIFIVLLGLGFCAPLNLWFMTLLKGPERYIITGIGYAIGSELFGRSAPALCLLLWSSTSLSIAPAFYIAFVSLLAFFSIITLPQKELIITAA